ncbi:MAG: glycosyltransferase family 2 protein, partial [Ottowia sp.]|nr:glycosyltransferase family 2 protein [Ottowia sp.]
MTEESLPTFCASLVSHGQGAQAWALLQRLAVLPGWRPQRVVLTLNISEPDFAAQVRAAAWPFDVQALENAAPLGFGANHNQAFARDMQLGGSDFFAVLNPDIAWDEGSNPFAAMRRALEQTPQAGLAYPLQCDAEGNMQDSERLAPSPARLLRRYAPWGQRQEIGAEGSPEWVNAACILLPRAVYAQLGGFDEGFRMYGEDVDLCLRLQLAGWRMARAEDARIIHSAARTSHRSAQHFFWHVASLWRL